MAAPRADSIVAPSGGTVRAGRSFMPTWAQIAVSTWAEIPFANTLHSIRPFGPEYNPNYPSNPEWWGNSGQGSIVGAWCGACYDDKNDEIWLPLNGGHADYAGNEPYRARIRREAPDWAMVRPPSGAVGNVLTTKDYQEATGVYSDGRPRAIHSYNKPVWVPGVGPCIAITGNSSWAATGVQKFLKVDPVTGEGTYLAELAGTPGTWSSGGGAAYDPSRHSVWWRNAATASFARYDVAANTWTAVGSSLGVSGYTSLCYLPDHDCLLWGNGSLAQKWAVFDCATGTLYQPTFSGAAAGNLRPGHTQPRWVQVLGAFVCWDNDSALTSVTRITPPANPLTGTWVIDSIPVAPANTVSPGTRAYNGTYGRCVYSKNLGGLIVFSDVAGPHHFFRLH